jgi:hypothetical protein
MFSKWFFKNLLVQTPEEHQQQLEDLEVFKLKELVRIETERREFHRRELDREVRMNRYRTYWEQNNNLNQQVLTHNWIPEAREYGATGQYQLAQAIQPGQIYGQNITYQQAQDYRQQMYNGGVGTTANASQAMTATPYQYAQWAFLDPDEPPKKVKSKKGHLPDWL